MLHCRVPRVHGNADCPLSNGEAPQRAPTTFHRPKINPFGARFLRRGCVRLMGRGRAGTDSGQLAECLGLEASKFHRQDAAHRADHESAFAHQAQEVRMYTE